MKEYAVEYRIRNNRIKERRQLLAMSQVKLAKAVGVSAHYINLLENFKVHPWLKVRNGAEGEHGEYRPAIKKVAAFFDVEPAELFPKNVGGIDPAKSTGEMKLDAAECRALMGGETCKALTSPEDQLISDEQISEVMTQLDDLAPRTKRMIEMKMGLGEWDEHTLLEIGRKHNLSRERTRIIIEYGMMVIRCRIREDEDGE